MVSIGPKIAIAGENEFRIGLRNIISGVKEFKSELDLTTASFSKWESNLSKTHKTQESLTHIINSHKAAMSGLTEGLKLANQAEENRKKKLEEATEAHRKAVEAEGAESDAAAKTAKELQKADNAYMQSQRVTQEWQTRINEATSELVGLENELKNLPNDLEVIGQSMQTWGDKISDIGTNITKYFSGPLLALSTYSVKSASDFEDGMAKIYTIATETQKPMSELRQELIELSNATGYGLDDLAEATYQAVSASVDVRNASEFMATAADLARGGFTTTTQAVDLLTTVINAYGMQAKDATYISDVLLKTQNDGKTIIDELAQSMGTVIPTAANYNVSLEQLAGAYATMTKQGVNTSRATTFLNAMFTELEKSSSQISKILDTKTGKSFAQLMGEGESLADVLKILYDYVEGDSEQFQRLFGNIRSGKAAAALVNNDFQTLTMEIERMGNATGQTAYAMTVLETPSLKAKRAVAQLKSSAVELGEQMINTLFPTFEKIIGWIKSATEWFGNLDDSTQENIAKFILWGAALGPIIATAGKVVSGIGGMVEGYGKLTKNVASFVEYASGKGGVVATMGSVAEGAMGIVPGLAAAAAGFIALGVAAKAGMDARLADIDAQWGMNEETRKAIGELETLNETYIENINTIKEHRDATLAEVSMAESLIEEYNKQIDTYGNVKQGHEELADTILTKLAEALGMEREDVEDLIETNGKFGQGIEENIEQIKRRAEMAAYEEMYTESIRQRTEAERILKAAESELESQQTKVQEAQEAYNQALADYQKYYDASNTGTYIYRTRLDDATAALGRATGDQLSLSDAVKTAQIEYDNASASAEYYADKMTGEVEEAVDDAEQAIVSGGKDIVKDVQNIGDDAVAKLNGVDTYTSGYNFVNGFTRAVNAYAWQASSAAYAMSSAALHSLNAGIQVASPSKLAYKSGAYFGEGFINGINESKKEAMQSANMLGEAALFGLGTIDTLTQTATKTVSAPISISVNVNGNVDDPTEYGRSLGETIVELINRESEVFA